MQGVGADGMNTDLTDWADAMRVGCYDKNRIKTPCGGNSHASSI